MLKEKKQVFEKNSSVKIGNLFKLAKYYFTSICKRNWVLVFVFILCSLFFSLFIPLFFYNQGKDSVFLFSYDNNDKLVSEEEFKKTLDRRKEQLESAEKNKMSFVSFQSCLYGGKSLGSQPLPPSLNNMLFKYNAKDLILAHFRELKRLEEEIEEQKERVKKIDKNSNLFLKEQKNLEFRIKDHKRRKTFFSEFSFRAVPSGFPFSIVLSSGAVTFGKDKKSFLKICFQTMLWLSLNLNPTNFFLSLLIFLLARIIFVNHKKNHEDSLIMLSCPGVTKAEIFLSRVLTFVLFLFCIFSICLVYPFTMCWFFFGAPGSVWTLFLFDFFVLFCAPVFIGVVLTIVTSLFPFLFENPIIFLFFFLLKSEIAQLPVFLGIVSPVFFYDIFNFSFFLVVFLFLVILGYFAIKKQLNRDLMNS